MQGFLEGPAYAHGLAHALHGRGEHVLGAGEFLEGKAGNLDNAVVDGRLKAGCRLPGDVVAQFVKRIAYGKLGRYFGNGEAGGLGGKCRGTGHTGVHFDDHHVAVGGIDAELHVGSACLDANFAHDGNGGVTHALVFNVCQRLNRGNGDGVAGMHAHGIEVFNGADDDDVVVFVAHDLHFHFLPADDALLDHDLGNRGGRKAALGDSLKVFKIVGNAAACAAERKGRAHNEREGQCLAKPAYILHGTGNA